MGKPRNTTVAHFDRGILYNFVSRPVGREVNL